jgi:hypothetical protein
MTEATPHNMRKYEDQSNVFAYSPVTEERYSATPGDYFMMPDDKPLLDEDGAPMVLAVERCTIRCL